MQFSLKTVVVVFSIITKLPPRHILRRLLTTFLDCVVKTIFSSPNYKFATMSHSKMVPDNRLRMCVVK